jgi:hypothetical protein
MYQLSGAAGYLRLQGNALELHRRRETDVRASGLASVCLALVNGSPIRSRPCIMLLAATFVNYVYTIKLYDILSGDAYHLM